MTSGVRRPSIGKAVLWAALIAVALIAVVPFVMMIMMSTQSNREIFSGASFLPGTNLAKNFQSVMDVNFPQSMLNSLLIAVSTTFLSVLSSAMAGYAFSKWRFKGSKLIFYIVLATMVVPMEVGYVAFIYQMRLMGLSQTYWPLILPNVANAAGVFWMTSYMRDGVMYEILESGRIDGCGEMGIFIRLVLPLVRPAMYSLCIISFLGSWNSYTLPMLMISKAEKYTIPLAIASLGNMQIADYGARILGVVIGIAPILVIFLFTSKFVAEGLTAGSLKG